jgi:gluconate kinase
VRFCHLVAGQDLVADRLSQRTDHYMPSSLLDSQFETLEPLQPDEPGVEVPEDGTVGAVLDRALDALGIDLPPTP